MYDMGQHNIFKCVNTMDRREERLRLIDVFERILKKFKQASTPSKVYLATGELYGILTEGMEEDYGNSWQVESGRNELIGNAEEVFQDQQERALTSEKAERYRQGFVTDLEEMIRLLNEMNIPQDLSNLMKTEKNPLSKLPPDVADKVASYVSGREGSIPSQMAQLRRGGRKTKKKRSSKKKTHGRRV